MPAASIANRSIVIFSYNVIYTTIYFAYIDKFTDLWVSLLWVWVNSGLGAGKQLSTHRLTHAVPYLRHKLFYFKTAHWPNKWIKMAENLIRDKFACSYAKDDAAGDDINIEVTMSDSNGHKKVSSH